MLWYTHIAFGVLSSLVLMPSLSFTNKIIFLMFVIFGSLLPDIDHPDSKINSYAPWLLKPITLFTKHRGVFHSLIAGIFFPGLIYYFISKTFGFALFLGYTSHLMIDGLTQQGINFLHPVSKLHLSGFIETGKLLEHILLIIFVLLILFRLF